MRAGFLGSASLSSVHANTDRRDAGYYGEDVAAVKYTLKRTRDDIKDQRCIKQLAGVQDYSPSEVRHSTPLLEMKESQLEDLLKQLQ